MLLQSIPGDVSPTRCLPRPVANRTLAINQFLGIRPHLVVAEVRVVVDVAQSFAKGLRVGVLEERLHKNQAILLRQGSEVSHDGPVSHDSHHARMSRIA